MASGKKAVSVDSTGTVVEKEDQGRINQFANQVARRNELRDDIETREKWLQNLGDAEDELVLVDDSEQVPYRIGEVFFHVSTEKAQACIEEAKSTTAEELSNLKKEVGKAEAMMSELRVQLYAKFGDNINLEDDSS